MNPIIKIAEKEEKKAGCLPRKIVAPLVALFKHGLAPRKIAECVALGILISLLPLPFIPTLLCICVAVLLRLNLPAMQAVNLLFMGLQWVLMPVFIRIGERLFRQPPMPFTPCGISLLYRANPGGFLRMFGMSFVHAVVAWALIAIPIGCGVYCLLLKFTQSSDGFGGA